MKKILLLLLLISCINVKAYPIKQTDNEIKEEIIPLKDNKNHLKKLNITITIPSYYDKDKIVIVPNIFNTINQYTKVKNNKIKVNINIINESKYNYKYYKNSLIIETDDITRFGISNNYKNLKIKGFDNKYIYDLYIPYRSYNEALKKLYNKKFKNKYLEDKNIEKKLKRKGYHNIYELDKYYLDYYNNKYKLNKKSINEFNKKIQKDIFTGNISKTKENNKEIIKLAYNYFYNNIIKLQIKNKEFSIAHYMNNRFDIDLNDNFNIIINTDKNYMLKSFSGYQYYGYLEFSLVKY